MAKCYGKGELLRVIAFFGFVNSVDEFCSAWQCVAVERKTSYYCRYPPYTKEEYDLRSSVKLLDVIRERYRVFSRMSVTCWL